MTKDTQRKIYNLNAKLPQEYKEMLEEIVDYYRSNIEVGRVGISDVLQNLIKTKHQELSKEK